MAGSPSDELNSDRRLDWCSMCLESCDASSDSVRGGGGAASCLSARLLRRASSKRRSPERSVACLSPAVLELDDPFLDLLPLPPMSLMLISCTSVRSLRSCPSVSGLLRPGGSNNTFSSGRYFFPMSSFSSCGRAFSGLDCRNRSSSVFTLASRLVSRTDDRHEGQVKGGRLRASGALEVCHENHSFRQEPQNVCRQSRRVKGW